MVKKKTYGDIFKDILTEFLDTDDHLLAVPDTEANGGERTTVVGTGRWYPCQPG